MLETNLFGELEEPGSNGKVCTKCRKWFELTSFRKTKTREGYGSQCISCCRKSTLAHYHNDPKKRENKLRSNLKHMYGITLEEYAFLLEAQNNVCAICKQPEMGVDSRTKKAKRLVVDHDHATGRVRGLLCSECNYSLGFLEKRLGHVAAILNYLETA